MPVEVVSYLLASRDVRKRLQFQLVLQCAPFLKGIKKASITNIERDDLRELCALLAGTGILFRVLTVCRGKYLVFFYRRREMESYLGRPKVQAFLKNYGYESGKFDEVLAHLALRVRKHSVEEHDFPHEIGVFLDYPLDDVASFIRQEGKHSLFAGYWKVYHNPRQAYLTFLAYDKAKDSAVNEFLMGRSIQEIASGSM